jgi:hypothetical protein
MLPLSYQHLPKMIINQTNTRQPNCSKLYFLKNSRIEQNLTNQTTTIQFDLPTDGISRYQN